MHLHLIADQKQLLSKRFDNNVEHSDSVGLIGMILYRKDNWVVIFILVAKSSDCIQSLFKVNLFVERFVLECMGYDRPGSIIMHI